MQRLSSSVLPSRIHTWECSTALTILSSVTPSSISNSWALFHHSSIFSFFSSGESLLVATRSRWIRCRDLHWIIDALQMNSVNRSILGVLWRACGSSQRTTCSSLEFHDWSSYDYHPFGEKSIMYNQNQSESIRAQESVSRGEETNGAYLKLLYSFTLEYMQQIKKVFFILDQNIRRYFDGLFHGWVYLNWPLKRKIINEINQKHK